VVLRSVFLNWGAYPQLVHWLELNRFATNLIAATLTARYSGSARGSGGGRPRPASANATAAPPLDSELIITTPRGTVDLLLEWDRGSETLDRLAEKLRCYRNWRPSGGGSTSSSSCARRCRCVRSPASTSTRRPRSAAAGGTISLGSGGGYSPLGLVPAAEGQEVLEVREVASRFCSTDGSQRWCCSSWLTARKQRRAESRLGEPLAHANVAVTIRVQEVAEIAEAGLVESLKLPR
jgi:hypothetical protein